MITVAYRALPRVRRTDRRPRVPLVAASIAAALAPVSPGPGMRLPRVLAAAWQRFGIEVWTVTDLRHAGLVEPADAHRLGHELGRALRRGGRVGDYTLVRLDAEDRGVRLWRLDVTS